MFKNIDLGGILVFCVDRRRKTNQFRLFDINDFSLLMEVEVYVDMHLYYRALRPNFYCFPLPNMVLGIEFSAEEDAKFFRLLVFKYCPKFLGEEQISDTQMEHNFENFKKYL